MEQRTVRRLPLSPGRADMVRESGAKRGIGVCKNHQGSVYVLQSLYEGGGVLPPLASFPLWAARAGRMQHRKLQAQTTGVEVDEQPRGSCMDHRNGIPRNVHRPMWCMYGKVPVEPHCASLSVLRARRTSITFKVADCAPS